MLNKIRPLKNKLIKNTVGRILSSKQSTEHQPSPDSSTRTSKNNNSKNNSKINDITDMYHSISGMALGVAVKPQVIGELPKNTKHVDESRADNENIVGDENIGDENIVRDGNIVDDENILTFYVLKEYSRSNTVLIDVQTKEHKMPPALSKVICSKYQINERAGIIFLHHPKADKNSKSSKTTKKQTSKHLQGNVSPRLQRLVTAVQNNPKLKIRLVPVTILWGRAPEKEDSLFKLLLADNWNEPSIRKQLFNIGVMGRDTLVEFHQPLDLSTMIHQHKISDDSVSQKTIKNVTDNNAENDKSTNKGLITYCVANHQIAKNIQEQIHALLDKRRTSIIGPDLSDKRNVIDKLLYTPAIKSAIKTESDNSGKSMHEVREQARHYLNEIVTDYSYPVVQFFDKFLNWLWTQLYDGVKVEHFDRVRDLATDHEIIYVPCHRSHIDYLLLSFIIYKQGLNIPNIAAGNNLNIPVVGQILRRGGAFFMRRTFKGNPLYGTVFKEYMHSMIHRNTPIKYFIEGGRSRSGRLLPPKLGMLSMTVQSHLRHAGKPIVFVPTYIGYERIMEGGTYIGELKGKPKESESILGILKTGTKLEKIFGTVHVSFGSPLFLDDFMKKFDVEPNSLPRDTTDVTLTDNAQDMISNLGIKIMQNINKSAVITPVSLLSLVLLSTPKSAIDEESCQKQIALYQNIATNLPYDKDTKVTDMSPKDIINYGIKLKLIERIPHTLGDMIQVADNQAPLLSYFKNNILHVFIISSFLSAIIERNGKISRELICSIAEQMYPFLQTELFLKHSHRNITTKINQKLDNLIQQGVIIDLGERENGHQYIGSPDINSQQYKQLKVLAAPIDQSLERYIMTLTLIAEQGSGKLTIEQTVDLCCLLGQRMSVLYADDIPDSFDKALFVSFINTLIRLKYLNKEEETGVLIFDQHADTIQSIAENARYILSPEILQILHNIADLDGNEIERITTELNEKKSKRFRKKK